jgi:hypothetical protein
VPHPDKQPIKILGVSLGVILLVVAALVGLAVVAFFILAGFALSSWGSNK